MAFLPTGNTYYLSANTSSAANVTITPLNGAGVTRLCINHIGATTGNAAFVSIGITATLPNASASSTGVAVNPGNIVYLALANSPQNAVPQANVVVSAIGIGTGVHDLYITPGIEV